MLGITTKGKVKSEIYNEIDRVHEIVKLSPPSNEFYKGAIWGLKQLLREYE